jgi:hypothetical protein
MPNMSHGCDVLPPDTLRGRDANKILREKREKPPAFLLSGERIERNPEVPFERQRGPAMTIVPTHYNGYHFRSRLEARWAVFFDALGIAYEYEKEGYDLGDVGRYLPDFWLPQQQVWVEIKGVGTYTGRDAAKVEALALETHYPVWVFLGPPTLAETGSHFGLEYQGSSTAGLVALSSVADSPTGLGGRLACTEADYAGAVSAARGARFEHGATPVVPVSRPRGGVVQAAPQAPQGNVVFAPCAVCRAHLDKAARRDFPDEAASPDFDYVAAMQARGWQVLVSCDRGGPMPQTRQEEKRTPMNTLSPFERLCAVLVTMRHEKECGQPSWRRRFLEVRQLAAQITDPGERQHLLPLLVGWEQVLEAEDALQKAERMLKCHSSPNLC